MPQGQLKADARRSHPSHTTTLMRNPLTLAVALSAAVLQPAQAEKLKVYILAGQSNMEGHAHIRTFKHVATDPESKSLADLMFDENGEPRSAERTWISYLGHKKTEKVIQEGKLTAGYGAPERGPKIGPEYTFGLALEKRMSNPILLIKTAWGGRSLNGNFRPPGAGPYKLNEWQIENARKNNKSVEELEAKINAKAGVEYRQMVAHVKDVLANIKRVYPDYDPKQGYEIAGFVWFQGWNDKVDKHTYAYRDQPGGYDVYSELLTHFIKDVRKDFDAPKMPFVIGVMGVGGKIDMENGDSKAARNQRFREAMAAPAKLPEFQGNVHTVWTENYWDDKLSALEDKRWKVKEEIGNLNKNKNLSKEERKQMAAELQKNTYTPEEQELYNTAISNFEFHYLGSTKIVGNIGVAFADALVPEETK